MRLRWPRFLPGFPAVLLMIPVLGLWAFVCTVPRGEDQMAHRRRGFPLVFTGRREVRELEPQVVAAIRKQAPEFFRAQEGKPILVNGWAGFKVTWFLLDLIIALAAAWGFAFAVDRLVFPTIRAARRRKRGTGEAG